VPKGGASGGEFVTETVLFVGADPSNPTAIVTPKPFPMRLRSQRTAIRGVSVDAEFCPVAISIYTGVSQAQGTPIVVQPGTARAFGIEGSSAIFVTFAIATSAGYARITVYPEPIEAFGMGTGAALVATTAPHLMHRLEAILDVLQAILAKLP
jgi:hypothetical protein